MLKTANKKAQKKLQPESKTSAHQQRPKNSNQKAPDGSLNPRVWHRLPWQKSSAKYFNQGDFDIVQREEKVDLNQQKNLGKIYLYLKRSQKFLSNHW